MTAVISRSELRAILESWQSGKWTAGEVQDWAEDRFAVDAWDCEDDVTNEVLAALDTLDMNLLIRDDVPVLRAMLQLPVGQAGQAAELLNTHFRGVDLDERKKSLASDPTYSRFCGK